MVSSYQEFKANNIGEDILFHPQTHRLYSTTHTVQEGLDTSGISTLYGIGQTRYRNKISFLHRLRKNLYTYRTSSWTLVKFSEYPRHIHYKNSFTHIQLIPTSFLGTEHLSNRKISSSTISLNRYKNHEYVTSTINIKKKPQRVVDSAHSFNHMVG